MNEVAWKEIEAAKQNRQPTPPVGEKVVWFQANDRAAPVAAQVTGIEGPGRLKLVVFPLNTFPQHKTGVYHVTAEVHKKPGNNTTRNCGSWDYVRGRSPEADYAMHDSEVEKRENGLLQAEEAWKKVNEKPTTAAAPAIKKKPLPDPLPAPAA